MNELIAIATVITAIATACSAFYVIRVQREGMARGAPPVRVREISRDGDLIFLRVTIYPTDHQVMIRRISIPGARIAVATYTRSEWGGETNFETNHKPSDFVDVDFDLLPRTVDAEPVELTLALRYRSASKTRTSLCINLHRSRSRFAVISKTTARISSEAD